MLGHITQMSLSRLKHWLPRSQVHPEVVQGTAELQHEIADAFFPQADTIFDAAITQVVTGLLIPCIGVCLSVRQLCVQERGSFDFF